MSFKFSSHNTAVQMDTLKNNNKNINQDYNEEQDDDPVELPPDTLAILNEFLQNKDKQKSLECGDMFEENWVQSIYIIILVLIK